ncbi:MAG TPA: CocE/NonD family hydrolase [Steroidobacteraceae bacterium]|jgi:putative CocE/NonD family hydrolase|nr:CocE/NonD family hydrolase [Steroidobacteraceae bacterium]
MSVWRASGPALWVACLACSSVLAQTPPMQPDVPPKFTVPTADFDYIKRQVMIPMRDGVRLYTVIVIPRGAQHAPIILTRTPYEAKKRAERFVSPHLLATLPMGDELLVPQGYIRVFQDVRGKYGSEGDYVMTRPLRGPLNPTAVDHSTDAYDTIDWLVKNVPESNGKVGMIGSSYEGFTVLMALINPHPALRAAVPMCPMVDGWKGDDWFHNGAFRQTNFDYIYQQTTARDEGRKLARGAYDDFQLFLASGSAGDFAHRFGIDLLPFFQKLAEHPAYDEFWSGQALDQILARQPLTVPTMYVTSLWDQEDMYGGVHAYLATRAQDAGHERIFLALGPWRHSGVNYDGTTLGPLKFDGNTARQFRREVMQPFLDEHLQDAAPPAHTPAAFVFETGTNVWRRLERWPLSCESGCPSRPRPLYLQPHFGLDYIAPAARSGMPYDEYVSDPAKPVPYIPRPVHFEDTDAWQRWLLTDQRTVADRTDVLTYTSAALTEPLHLGGAPMVNLYASTSGTDSDWVVKLIDVYPDEMPSDPTMGGYQLAIAMDIFRGRYRDSFSRPSAIPAGKVQRYRFALPHVNHVFLPGHRVMVQIQSSWFPLYDRNPQSYVDNIFFAGPGDYRKATQRVFHSGAVSSYLELPVAQ